LRTDLSQRRKNQTWMVGFHATHKEARVVSRATGAVKQNRLCVEEGNGAGHQSAKTAHNGRISYWHFALTSVPQSSSASRFTAGAFGFSTFTQCAERPER
jgi:hypothetical protein